MEMNEYNIIKIKNHPELICRVAEWFHHKWHIPAEEYRKSMEESLQSGTSVPQWYLVVEDSRIIGGAGVIENDFHKRKDLTPNVTDHTSFYERYGWEYLCMVEEDEGGMTRMYIHNGKE